MIPSWPTGALCVCIVSFFAIASQSSAFTTDPSSVDLSIAIKFSGYEVSQYIVDKNFNFEFRKRPSNENQESVSNWFIQFISHQALIAELRSEGWHRKPEVVRDVIAMEKYMLLQDDSPVFQKLAAPSQITPPKPPTLRKDASTRVTGSFLKLTSKQAAAHDPNDLKKLLSSGELNISPLGTTGIHTANTVLSWPFDPFMEFRDEITAADIGGPYGPFESRDSVLYFAVFDKDTNSPLFANESDDELAEYALFIEQALEVQALTRKILRESELKIYPDSQRNFLDSITHLGNGISQVTDSSILSYPLFSYTSNKSSNTINIGQFVDSLNSAIQRQPITTESDLLHQIEQHTLSSLLYELTQSPKFSYDPKFEQDRLNFENNCIPEHYKAHQRRTNRPFSEKDLKKAFTKQFGGKTKVLEIVGDIEVYKSPDSFLQKEPPDRINKSISINVEDEPLFYGMPTSLLASLGEGECSMPFALNSEYAVFRKKDVSKSRPFTLNETRQELEQSLFLRKFTKQTIEELHTRINDFQMRCGIDFSKYNIPSPLLATP